MPVNISILLYFRGGGIVSILFLLGRKNCRHSGNVHRKIIIITKQGTAKQQKISRKWLWPGFYLLLRPLAVDHHTICSLIGSVKLLLDGLLFGFEGLPPELFGFGPLLPFPKTQGNKIIS